MASVYIFGATESGPLKIGFSVSPESRLNALQGGHPYKLHILRTWQHPYAYAIETEAKRLLKPLRTHGEWFSVGFQAASEAVEQAKAAVEARPAIEPMPETDEPEEPPEPGSIAAQQIERVAKIEEIEAEMGRGLSRREIINLELAGVFGKEWADVRREQGRRVT